MHLVIVDTTFTTPPLGGNHTFLEHLCGGLVQKGWRVSVITEPGPETSIASALRDGGTEVHEDLWRKVHLPEERAARVASWVNAQPPDAYVISTSPDAGWVALPLLNSNIPTVSIAHNDVGAFYEPLKHYCDFIDCAVGVSEEIHRKIIAECGVPAERARTISYGVDSLSNDDFSARNAQRQYDRLRIAYVGRVVEEQKRVSRMLPVCAELLRLQVDFELHIIGDGPDRASLQEQFRSAGLDGNVKFHGWRTQAEVKRLLREMDVFLLLSDYEGLPVALLEAMGQGIVPVVTRIASGNSEVLADGTNGYFVNIGDFENCAARLGLLAQDKQRMTEMSAEAWKTAQEYTIPKMVKRYLETFGDLMLQDFPRAPRAPNSTDYPLMPSCVSRYPQWLRKMKRRLAVSAGTGR